MLAGTGATDFPAQLTGLTDEYSIIAFHPDTSQAQSLDFLEKDAHDAAAFMTGLGYDKAFLTGEDLALYAACADVATWSDERREEMIAVHGGVGPFQAKWTEWIATMARLLDDKNGDLCTAFLPDVKCKTLVLHGEQVVDSLVPAFQGEYLSERILHSKLIMLPDADHAFHMEDQWSAHTNQLIRTFLNEPDDSATHSREFSAMPPKDRKRSSIVTHSGPRC
ncbi:hypothetical protein DYB30_006678 [Aphanomyces astaci]|uniref:Uncharacterized protein n=1 Tax=Aphanomyces astaci TaxID=112090 RepID=A0A397DMU5_APHAT|nr:hypothetical protein DYB30_006678 [Aphanomyces astaci]RHY67965.1 hypothetical protein DYB38_009787 [Aphanomyces astaci]RHY79187.1 hypothetical protein DYB31_004502 [Aphanomyces astaci]RHZ39110.1 hypothetical protein DYB26_003212 [Aphanomyces astaci]